MRSEPLTCIGNVARNLRFELIQGSELDLVAQLVGKRQFDFFTIESPRSSANGPRREVAGAGFAVWGAGRYSARRGAIGGRRGVRRIDAVRRQTSPVTSSSPWEAELASERSRPRRGRTARKCASIWLAASRSPVRWLAMRVLLTTWPSSETAARRGR